ncbi:MAG: IS3 family transposase [Alphaproteobacteria bacterium]|nr:IS3 family transposase [Alphaproteobacteria bacterium]
MERRAWREGIYAVIQATMQLQGNLGIERLCALSGVSRAGYYRHWQAWVPRQEETALRDEVQRLSLANRHYGIRRITVLLRRAGWPVNHKRVERIRREDNLLCVPQRAFVPATTDSRHRFRVYPNLARQLIPTAANQLWVADITYVRLLEEFVYLAVVLDAFSRRVIGWQLETHLQASLALAALDMALLTREVVAGRSGASFRSRGAGWIQVIVATRSQKGFLRHSKSTAMNDIVTQEARQCARMSGLRNSSR